MTIQSGDELRQAMVALTTLRKAMDALRRDVGSVNARNFAVMAEGTLDEIARLESDVDAYLGKAGRGEEGR